MLTRLLICLLNISLAANFTGVVQHDSLSCILKIPTKSSYATADNLGNIYVVNGNVCIKYNARGVKTAEFSYPFGGKISIADATDPLKVILFSSENKEIILVDNNLVQKGSTLQLHKLGFIDPKTVCKSYENGCWIFDEGTMEIARIDNNGTITHKTENLFNLSFSNIEVVNIFENNFYLYAIIKGNGLWKFDRYGNFAGEIPLSKQFLNCIIIENKLVVIEQNQLTVSDIQRNIEKTFKITQNNISHVNAAYNKLLAATQDTLFVYNLNINL